MTTGNLDIFGSNKLWACMDRVQVYQAGGIPPPVTMELDLTDFCNHKCPKCIGGRAKRKMRSDDARRVLREMAEYGVRGVIFTGGGEPLMHKDCVALCEFAAQQGLRVGLITNGTLVAIKGGMIDTSQSESLVQSCDWIRVSLDAGDDALYRKVHGVDEFAKAADAISQLAYSKRKLGVDCTVGVGYLTSAATKRGMLDATQLARRMSADYIQFRPYHYDDTDIMDALTVCRQHETESFKVLASEQKYRHFANWRRPYETCHGAHFVGAVQADGTLPICCHYRGVKEMEYGNVLQQGLKELWHSKDKKDLLERIDVQKCVPFCRADHINRLLQDASQPKTHAEFL